MTEEIEYRRVERVNPNTTYVVPVSGGKDSQMVLAWALQFIPRAQLRCVHQNTGYDHPLTYEHLRYMARRYGVKIEHTHSEKYADIFDLILKQRFFPNALRRSCTTELKQRAFGKWLQKNADIERPDAVHVFLGMRMHESANRKQRYQDYDWDTVLSLPDISSRYSNRYRHVTVSLPIVAVETEAVFEFLHKRGDRVNPLYARGHTRVGCYPCLLTNNAEWRLASADSTGRHHIQRLVQIQDKLNAEGVACLIHPTRDVRALLTQGEAALGVDDDKECGWCSI